MAEKYSSPNAIIKDYGITTQAEEELFKNKYGYRYIKEACITADNDCEFIGTSSVDFATNRAYTSIIKLKAGQIFKVSNVKSFISLKIKAPIGTNYDISFGVN